MKSFNNTIIKQVLIVNNISNLNLIKLLNEPRVYMLFLIIFSVIEQPIAESLLNSKVIENDLSNYIFTYLLNTTFFKLIITFGVIILFCDAPFKTKEQIFIVTRSSKSIWVLGQYLFILKCSFAYYSIIYLLTNIITLIPKNTNITGIALNTNLIWNNNLNVNTILLNTLVASFLAILMFVLNSILPKFVGATVCVFLILLTLMQGVLPSIFTILNPINMLNYPSLAYAYIYLIFINIMFLIISIKITNKKMLGGAY